MMMFLANFNIFLFSVCNFSIMWGGVGVVFGSVSNVKYHIPHSTFKDLGKIWFSEFFGSINLLWLFFPMIGLISPSILVEDFIVKTIFPKSAKELVYVLCTLLIFSKWRLPFVASTYIKIQLSQWQLLIWRRRIENKRYKVLKNLTFKK